MEEDYVALPRGCEDAVITFLEGNQVAIVNLTVRSNGILNVTTALGKTVTAIGLIAEWKVNTRNIGKRLDFSLCKHVVTLVGPESAKEKRQKMEYLQKMPPSEPLVIVVTGKYVGEGFEYPRLDALFRALPVSWKGIIAQYAGWLHREYLGKKEVRIYDYIDMYLCAMSCTSEG